MLFAKAPVVGTVKTRLIPKLGAESAAQLHQRLVERALQTLVEADVGPVEICCAPDTTHPFFAACRQRFGVALTRQREGGLGERMQAALEVALAGAPCALIVGADCPALTVEDVRAARSQLNQWDAAVIAAEDGGYVLIGVRATHPAMFNGIDWGTATVLAAQRDRFRALGWRWHEGAIRWDVDRPADLPRLLELEPPFAFKQ